MDLLSSAGFMPHGHCYMWALDVLIPTVIGHAMIASAYVGIPLALRRSMKGTPPDWRVPWSAGSGFVAFILLCAVTHGLAIVSIWRPLYRLEAPLLLLTGLVSWATLSGLLVHGRFILHRPPLELWEKLQAENDRLRSDNARLSARNAKLEAL